MSGEEARTAWKRLWLTLPATARKEWFGLPKATFCFLRAGRAPRVFTLLRIAKKYELDPDFVLHGHTVADDLGEFPLSACQYRYTQLPLPDRLRLFAHVALHQYHEAVACFPQAVLRMEDPKRVVIRIEVAPRADFEIVCEAGETSMVFYLQKTMSKITRFFLFADEGKYGMAQFRPIIQAHIRTRNSPRAPSNFDKTRRQSEKHMSWQHN
jgi:hypothetical protein